MKHVFLLAAGGTLSSSYDNETNALKPHFTAEEIIDQLPELKKITKITSQSVFSLDSSNMQPYHWKTIAEEVYKNLQDYDGIVITHGTDTMTYTASALSFFIQNLPIPVICTGSQMPFWKIGSDARRNLVDSLRVASNADMAEVAIVFNNKIIRGSRAKKFRELGFDAFESVGIPRIGEAEYQVETEHVLQKRGNQTPRLDTALDPNVVLLKLFPGLKPDIVSTFANSDVSGLVIEAFGAGNVPIKDNSLIPAIKDFTSTGRPVIISTQCVFGRAWVDLYETGKVALNAGAIPAYDMISETALVKLMWVLGHTKKIKEIETMMHTNYAGEITENIQTYLKNKE